LTAPGESEYISIMMDDSSLTSVGVLGATGYTGRELLALLAAHPRVRIGFATSESEAGSPLRRLVRGAPELTLVRAESAPLDEVDVVFSCLPHGDSARWVERVRAAGVKAIDLSADLRVPGETTPQWARGAVYGLPELHREEIRGAELVANPGCYPTCALLSIVPLVREGVVGEGPIVINAASGVTGAGRSPKRELLFAEVGEDYRAYAVGNVHRHLGELRHQVGLQANGGAAPELIFTPHLLPVRRGILETIYVPLADGTDARQAGALLEEAYADEPFVEVLREGTPSLRDVVETNRVALAAVPLAGVSKPMVIVVSAIDNLGKGAAGQAVQNLNLISGWDEALGLR
jgi:N-acetyl-gamma-glutamyl-phosphate reductase